MRTVLIGTDSVYHKDGNLRPIEINTNIGWAVNNKIESDESVFDLTELREFITQHNFTKIAYIGVNQRIENTLSNLVKEFSTITYSNYIVGSGAITVPYVEDNDDTLIIRSAYDTTAIVDDTYCADKVNFLELIKDQSFGAQFAYKNSEDILINRITNIPDNGTNPNFILKSRFPNYDKAVYPKLFKVSSVEELSTVLSDNIDNTNFLMEFYCNEDKVVDSHLVVYRTLNLLVPPSLSSISIGGYTTITNRNLDNLSTYNSETFELTASDRNKYITLDTNINLPKILDTDEIEMADGTFKYPHQLTVGDLIKTIAIPNPNGIDIANEAADYNINYDTFVSESYYTVNTITNLQKINHRTPIATITFDDNTTWQDTGNSTYLTLSGNDIRFKYIFNAGVEYTLQPGDGVVLVDTSVTELTTVLKVVANIALSGIQFDGWTITVVPNHVFLTRNEGNQSYATIEHNAACASVCESCLSCNGAGGCVKGQYCTWQTVRNPCGGRPCSCTSTCDPGTKPID